MFVRLPALLLPAVALAPLAAQSPVAPTPANALSAPTTLGTGAFRAPIHTSQADEALGAYGVWASGDDYKVSFHDGFVFYPWLGKDYAENLPLRWRTRGITAGGEPLVEPGAPTHSSSAWRYEYRWPGVTEAYDVRADGVEQTFVIAARPRSRGDIVVHGEIETALQAAAVSAAHQALEFADAAGNPLVRYGAAVAVDARGQRLPMTTAFDGANVRLVVPAAWLETAQFPVTIDPLTSRVTLGTNAAAFEHTAIFHEDESPEWNTMVVFTRQFTAGDHDVHARLAQADLAMSFPVMAQIDATFSDMLPDVTFVAGADRWVTSFWRHTGGEDRVRAYVHDKDNLVFNSGVVASNYNPGGEHASFPAIGGRSHPTEGTDALIVHRADPFYGNSATSQIWGVAIDAVTRSFATSRTFLAGGPGRDCESPDVNATLGWGDDGWLVVWQERIDAVDDYDLRLLRVRAADMTPSTYSFVGPDGLGDKVRPVVQGWDGRYLIAALQDTTPEIHGQYFARNVMTIRVDWPTFGGQRHIQGHRFAYTGTPQDITDPGLAFDGVTWSHWLLTFDRDVFTNVGVGIVRLGSAGVSTEATAIHTPAYHASAAWNGAAREFQIVNCAFGELHARRLQHSTASWLLLYGNGCGPGQIVSDTIPYPGSQFFRMALDAAPPGQLAGLAMSPSGGSSSLASIGAPNCWLNLAAVDVLVPTFTDSQGDAGFTFALPNAPLFLGDLYFQWVYLWPAAPTPLTIGTTRGMRASVR